MNPENGGNGPDSLSNILMKRKRGRPRKDQNQNISRIANIISMRDRIQRRGEYAPVAPGFARVNGDHSHQENAADEDDNAKVGQTVTGVVEATFDAGYLLSVRVGNSETSLRGIVFKPGHYVPVSTENDVVPHIQMIRRNVGPFPAGVHTPVHGSYRRGRGRGRPRNESRFSYSVNGSSASNTNHLQIVPVQPPASLVGDRGVVVPVVLQHADLSNGVAPAMEAPPLLSQPAHLAASRARLVNGTQISQVEKDLEIDNGSPSSVKLPRGVKEELANEIQNENAQLFGTAFTHEQMEDLSPPLSVEPLQAFHSDFLHQSPSVSQNFREARAGKMTELLLSVQENVIDKQATDMQHRSSGHLQN